MKKPQIEEAREIDAVLTRDYRGRKAREFHEFDIELYFDPVVAK